MATMAEDIAAVLESLGGEATLSKIYSEIRSIRPGPHPVNLEAGVRRTIEIHSSDSKAFTGTDLYYSVEGIGRGIWGIIVNAANGSGGERYSAAPIEISPKSAPLYLSNTSRHKSYPATEASPQ